jgi:hypothetical protein
MDNLANKLNELKNKYFLPGNYIIDFPTNFTSELQLNEKYNGYLEAIILEGVVNITILDVPVEVIIHQPIREVHRYEFEEHFGFGGHCKGFDPNKKIVLCPKYPIMPIDELYSKLNKDVITEKMSEDTVKELCLLMILGGYWNKRQAINDLMSFFHYDINVEAVFDLLFQKI